MKGLQHILCMFGVLSGFHAFANEAPAPITAAQFRQDIAFIRDTIPRMHPDPGFSTDPRAVQAALDRLGQELPSTLSRDEAWQRLATLNPLLADAHFFVGYPDWRGDTRAWLAGGGSLFPVEVTLQLDGQLFIKDETASAVPTRIVAINGMAADAVVAALLAKAHGDTEAFRANLLAERWWLFHWKTFGAAGEYRLAVEQGGKRRELVLPGSRTLPRLLREEADASQQFNLAIRPDAVAVLKVGSFDQPDPAPFAALTRDAFSRIRQGGTTTLLIDIGGNGGGNDSLWLEGLMPYLASTPYRTGSTHRSMSRTEPGKVADGEIATWRAPQPDHPLRFTGKVYVRIDEGTYSSAVLFANVMQDFGFATLIGTGKAARRSQSGGVRDVLLPHSRLMLVLPRFILDPPAGRVHGALLEASPAPAGIVERAGRAGAAE